MKSSYVMDTCKYLAIMIIIFYTTLIISRSLNWQSNIIKLMTIREGYIGGDIFGDDSDDSDDSDDEEEEEFDPDDFRDKVRKILDLLDDIKKKEGEGYFKIYFGGLEQTDDYKLARELWDEDEDEWMEDAYSEANETRLENYYNKLMPYAKNIDKKFENQKSPKGFKKQYGETGITYAKRGLSILLDKDMGMDMGGGLEKSSGMGFSF
jgi:hypothetical protein